MRLTILTVVGLCAALTVPMASAKDKKEKDKPASPPADNEEERKSRFDRAKRRR